MPDSHFPLGVFDLQRLIGEGGMGEVWRGVHRTQGVPVAVKVLRSDQASQPKIRQAFLREVRSVAKLLHNGIIRIIDYGEIGRETHEASRGVVTEGCPYIAMELATLGSLGDMSGVFNWRQLRWMLIEILNGLAHAHARDLIHRDLKPDNILMTQDQNGQTILKLTDFGIVHVVDPTVSNSTQNMSTLYAGTPAYMSPEQLRGRWREFGPWTDLYSLGCVAFEVCCGRLPFEGDNLFEIAHLQMSGELPELEPRMAVPKGFHDWVARMLAKNPQDRFQRAADAAWALAQLPDVDEAAEADVRGQRRESGGFEMVREEDTWLLDSNPEHTSHNTLHQDLTTMVTQIVSPAEADSRPELDLFVYKDNPPIPESWHRAVAASASIQLMGAGLGLWGLRETPFVARYGERDRAWSALVRTHRQQRPRGLIVRGPTGIGKTRIAEWVCERGHEVGGAIVLKTSHSAEASKTSGLMRMVERQLSAYNLSAKKTYSHIKHLLNASSTHRSTSDLDALALTELLIPGSSKDLGDGPRINLSTPRERYIVLARLLRFLCQERPVVMFLDDAHWSSDSLEIARLVLCDEETANLPVCVVLVVNDDARSIRPASQRIVDELVQHRRVDEVRLNPLNPVDQRKLVDALLVLDEPLPSEVVKLSHGNPMFAVQLMGQWIQRDILRPGNHGYILSDGAEAFLPKTLDQLWHTRLDQLVHAVAERNPRFSTDEIHGVLEIAAALGQQVLFKEWGGACTKRDLSIPSDLLDALVTQGMAAVERESWSFTHEQLRILLIRQSREIGRWPKSSRACAAMIDALYDRSTPGAVERLAVHLLEAGDYPLAVNPLLHIIDENLARSDYDRVSLHLDNLSLCLERMSTPSQDALWGQLSCRYAELAAQVEGVRESLKLINQTIGQAHSYGWGDLMGHLHAQRAELLWKNGNVDAAQTSCDEASELFADRGDELGLTRCFTLCAHLSSLRNRQREARRWIASAIDLCDELDPSLAPAQVGATKGDAYIALARVHLRDGSTEKARRSGDVAVRFFTQHSDQYGLWMARALMGDISRAQGAYNDAEQHYLEASSRLSELGHCAWCVPKLQYSLVLLEERSYPLARDILSDVLDALTRHGYHLYLCVAQAALAMCYAGMRDPNSWREHYLAARKVLETFPIVDPDLAWLSNAAGDLLHTGGASRAAVESYALAYDQYLRLGDGDRAKAIRRHSGAIKAALVSR